MAISNKTGSPVSGDDFFDREWEFEQLVKSIRAREQVLISAPRRVGKSSLMKKALNWGRAQGYIVADADAQKCVDESGFLEILLSALKDAGVKPGLLKDLQNNVSAFRRWLNVKKLNVPGGLGVEFGESGPPEWQTVTKSFDQLFDKVCQDENCMLIGLDELPIFLARLIRRDEVGGARRVDAVLHWLRFLRQKHERVLWIICGSVGLDTFAEQHNLVGAINDLRLHRLGAFSETTAYKFLETLGASPNNPMELSDEVIRHIIDKVGWPLPYFLQLVFHAVGEVPPDARSSEYLAVEDVNKACDDLYGAHYTKYFAHWVTRLRDQLSKPDAEVAELILNAVSQNKRGLSKNKILQLVVARRPNADLEGVERQLVFLLDVLERDGYFLRTNSIYAFRSFILREFWKRRAF